MKTSAAGRAKITQREGNKLKAYTDTVGVLTIGVGHTSAAGPPKVTKGMTITAAESDAILSRDLTLFEKAVNDAVKVPVTQNQFDALVSLAFNIGTGAFKKSTLVKRLNAGDVAGAGAAFMMWNKPKEIIGRRKTEQAQFMSGGKAPAAKQPAKLATLPEPAPDAIPVVPDPPSKETIQAVQSRLKDLGYNPGGADGKMGPLTRGAILSFKNDAEGLTPNDTIDEAFLTALATASPRKMAPDRANATATDIAAKVPEANAHWWNKYLAGSGAGTGVLLAVGDAIAPAKSYVDQLREDVPAWAWFLLFAIFCGGIAYMALRGQKSSDEAYRTGERR